MAKFLITGCNGQVGRCLTQQLQREQLQGKHEVCALDHHSLDISDEESVKQIVLAFQPDIIINAAAYTSVDKAESEAELAAAINVSGPCYLAQIAETINAAILHISTDYVFNGQGIQEYKERDLCDPQGVYGQTKLDGERAVQQATARHIILRTAWVFGEHGNNFVKTMLRLAKEHDTLNVVGDQVGSPTYAGDIAFALIAIAEKILTDEKIDYGIYHFSGAPYVSWFEFAEAIFSEAVAQGVLATPPILNAITTNDYPTPAKRPANSKLDLSKIKTAFGIAPSDWIQAIKHIRAYVD